MSQRRICGRRYDTGQPVEITVQDGYIAAVRPLRGDRPVGSCPGRVVGQGREEVLEAGFVAPGWCDIQVNGALGYDFTSRDLTCDQIRAVSEALLRHGTTAFLPTVITSDTQTLQHALGVMARAVENDPLVRQMVLGFHLEGPYISPEPGPRGAHPLEHVRPPDREEFRRLQESAAGFIRLITLAPTWPGAADFIAWLTEQGIVVALGHHNANAQQISEAVRAGARLCTHLGNGCDLLLPRHPNYLWEQLANDALWASLICDGHHLPGTVIKCIVRCKTPARCVLISDATALAGLPPGRYSLWGKSVELRPDGRTALVDERGQTVLAGAALFQDVGVLRVWQDAEISLAQAIELASFQPRRLLGLPCYFLEVGQPANLVLFDLDEDRLLIRWTVLGDRVLANS